MLEQNSYWARRLQRRRFLGIGLGAGAAAFALACGGGEEKKETKATQAPAGSPAAGVATAAPAKQLAAVKVGGFCDRSGATANVGNILCEGIKDWNDYANANNIYGRKIEWVEFDHTYEVPKAQQGWPFHRSLVSRWMKPTSSNTDAKKQMKALCPSSS